VIDLITNIDWQAFQAVNGLQVFIDRLEHEVNICRKDAPPACDILPGASASSSSDGKMVRVAISLSRLLNCDLNVLSQCSLLRFCLPQNALIVKIFLRLL